MWIQVRRGWQIEWGEGEAGGGVDIATEWVRGEGNKRVQIMETVRKER